MITEEQIIKGGTFVKTHGLNGELNIFSEYPTSIYEEDVPIIIDIDGLYVPFFITGIRARKTFGCVVKLQDIDSKEQADLFTGKNFYLLRTWTAEKLDVEIDELEQDTELVGYTLEDVNHGVVGIIEDIDDSNVNILMKVLAKDEDGMDKEILLPLHEDFIQVVDEADKKLIVELPQGCLDIN